jgi:hypothetical protein
MINGFDAALLPREKRDRYIGRVKDHLAANDPDRIVH